MSDHGRVVPDRQADVDAVVNRRDFALLLTQVRERAGLTIRDVARVMDLPDSTVGGYFAGRHLPPVRAASHLPDLLRACGVTEDREIGRWVDVLHRIRRSPGPRAVSEPSPYRGLDSFDVEHADWFFGREELTRRVVGQLVDPDASADGPVLVVGPSGSGKTSLLRAGVIPALTEVADPCWQVLLFTPGHDPVGELAKRFADLLGDDRGERLRAEPTSVVELIAEVHARSPGTADHRLLIVVDQFEELYTTCRVERDRSAFVTALCTAAADGGERGNARVVLGLRADFYGHLLRDPSLAASAQRAQVVVGPMSPAELRRAIAEPARKACLDVDEGLVELVVRDLAPAPDSVDSTGHDAGALPLLSHALAVTWVQSSKGRLTIAAYEASGGISGAVARSAEAVYDGLSESQRRLARHLFLRLVQVADDVADTRRRVPYDELVPAVEATSCAEESDTGRTPAVGDDPDELDQVLDRFVEARLLTLDTDTVDITHEALLVAWPRLRSWIDADRAGLRIHRQLTHAAHEWRDSGYDRHCLYRGTRLAAAVEWLNEAGRRAGLSRLESRFLTESIADETRERRTAQRRTRRLRQLVAALTVLCLLGAGLVRLAFHQRSEANRDRDLAMSRQMATSANELRRADPNLAAQIAVAAFDVSPTAEARSSLLDSYAEPVPTRISGPPGVLQTVAVSADNRLLASAGAQASVQVWDLGLDRRRPPGVATLTGHTDTVYSVAFHPSRRWIASGSGDRTVRTWDLTDPAHPDPLGTLPDGPTSTVYSVAISPDGRTLAAGSADETVRFWDLDDPRRPVRLGPPVDVGAAVHSVTFSPDGRTLVTGAADGTVRRWTVGAVDDGGGTAMLTPVTPELAGFGRAAYTTAFSPDGRMMAAGSADGTVRLWNLADPAPSMASGILLTGPTSWVNGVSFSKDGRSLAAAGSDNRVWVWNLSTRQPTATLPHPGPVTAAVFLAGGQTLATTAADGTTRLWDLPGPVMAEASRAVFNVAFRPDGAVLVAASGDDVVRVWDTGDPRRPTAIGPPLSAPAGFGRLVGTAALSADAQILAAGGIDGAIHLWSLRDPHRPEPLGRPLTGLTRQAESLAFSRDGTRLAVGGHDHTVRLWDLRDPHQPKPVGPALTGFTNYVFSVAFSPDGTILAAGSADRTVRLWRLTDPSGPTPLGPPKIAHDSYVYSVTFSPDGRTLATGSADKSIRFWDVRDPASLQPLGQPLSGPNNYVYMVEFSPDGRTIAAATGDGGVWMWDTSDTRRPRRLAQLSASDNTVYTVSFTRDGHRLAAGGADRVVRIWDMDPARVVHLVCAITGTPITPAEWERHLPGIPFRPACSNRGT